MQQVRLITDEGVVLPPLSDLSEFRIDWGLGLPFAVSIDGRRQNAIANAQKGPILEIAEPHERACAVVGYGPSLLDTINEIRSLDVDIFTVSGAHDLLISHGIIPKGHIEIDPRKHKAKFLEHPHKDVTYYLATGCDPVMFDNVKDHNVIIWNLYTYQEDDDDFFQMIHGPNAFCLDVGCSVGNAAMVVAGCLGYRNFHVFGFDCSMKDGKRHAGEHYGPSQRITNVRLGDKSFVTTPQMIAAAQDFFTLMARMGGPNFTIYGEGLMPYWIDTVITENERTQNV